MPPTNPARRRAIADAAIALLAASGVHGVTHRAVEQAAGLPPGTASNYFRSREALLIAAAHRIVELHHADTGRAAQRHSAAAGATDHAGPADRLADLLAESLFTAATTLRTRYQAIYELQLESVRRPALASVLAGPQDSSIQLTADQHSALELSIPTEAIPTLVALYGGALFTLVTTPPERISKEAVHGLAYAIAHGALPDSDGGAAANRKARRRKP